MKKFLFLFLLFLCGRSRSAEYPAPRGEDTRSFGEESPPTEPRVLLTVVCPDGAEPVSGDNGESWLCGGVPHEPPELYFTVSEGDFDFGSTVSVTLHNEREDCVYVSPYYSVELKRGEGWTDARLTDIAAVGMVRSFAAAAEGGQTVEYRLKMENYEPLDGRYRYYAEIDGYRIAAEFEVSCGSPAAEAYRALYDSFEVDGGLEYVYPENFCGAYADGEALVVLLNGGTTEGYDFLGEYCEVRFGAAERSMNELDAVRKKAERELREMGALVTGASVVPERGRVAVAVWSDTLPDKLKEYAKGLPLDIELSGKKLVLLA